MNYLVPDVSEGQETDPLTGAIIGASVNGIVPIHEAQLLSYLRLYGACMGCDKNFDECPKFTLNSPLTFSLTSQLKFFSSNQ
jgi:hypothetical protein